MFVSILVDENSAELPQSTQVVSSENYYNIISGQKRQNCDIFRLNSAFTGFFQKFFSKRNYLQVQHFLKWILN